MSGRLLYSDEAAALVGIKPATWRQWVHRYGVPAFTFDDDGRPLYLDTDVYEMERQIRTGFRASRP